MEGIKKASCADLIKKRRFAVCKKYYSLEK